MNDEQREQERDEEVVVGDSGHGSLSEQQPQETGTSSAHPAESQSGIGASGVESAPGGEPTEEGDGEQ